MIWVQFWASLMPECGKEGVIVGQAMSYTGIVIKWEWKTKSDLCRDMNSELIPDWTVSKLAVCLKVFSHESSFIRYERQ